MPDGHGFVQVQAPNHLEPAGVWFDKLVAAPCLDCVATVVVRWRNSILPADDEQAWHVVITHSEGCPWMATQNGRQG